MNNNTPQDESEDLTSMQSFYNHARAFLTRFEENIIRIREGGRIDELTPDQRARYEARCLSNQKRLLNLLRKIEKAQAKRHIKSSNDD